MKVFVLNHEGKPLMPTKPQKARKLLKKCKATVVRRTPFTIQLNYKTGGAVQDITIGIDAGYAWVGFSAVTEKEELIGGDFELLKGVSERITGRRKYRSPRRSRLRHRKPGFFKDTKSKGWFAPSIKHKLDSHLRLVNLLKELMPITKIILEVANFDIQKIKNPTIEGKDQIIKIGQNGHQAGWKNVREYVLHRDHHQCQSPKCQGKKPQDKNQILVIHHLGYWKKDRTNRPDNLITLCTKCHTAKNHQPKGFLYNWDVKLKNFKGATFMTTVKKKMVSQLECKETYGYITKSKRIEQKLGKSHHNDAFVIANGSVQTRYRSFSVTQRRRNNRSLERFYDAKYIDIRTGQKESGKDLSSQKTTRSRENLKENLRQYRGFKLKKGKRAIRKQRYHFQPGDLVRLNGKILIVKGTMSNGNSVLLSNKKGVTPKKLNLIKYGKGLTFKLNPTF